MRDLVNKLFLYLCCTCFLILFGLDVFSVFITLSALITTSACSYFRNPKIPILMITLYSICCFLWPLLGVYIPLSLYDSRKISADGTPPSVFPLFPLALAGCIPLFFRLPRYLDFPFLFLSVIAVLLAEHTRELENSLQKLHQLQDDSRENSRILNDRNQALLQTQDYKVHVATLSERNRIAREIHDNVGHLLTRSILQVGALKVLNKDPALTEPISGLHNTLNTAMTNIRESVHDLHDESIDLPFALQNLAKEVNTVAISLDYDVDSPMDREIKYAFISIVREAIQNIQKHSNATRAEISVREHPAFYQLQILDNGHSPQIKNTGIGLANMRQRVETLGGTIRFSTTNGFGIHIAIWRNIKKTDTQEADK